MKKLLGICVLSMFLSCSKDDEKDTSLAGSFVGNWAVSESTSTTTGAPVMSIGFIASTVKLSDSTFKIVQSDRIPRPAWVDEYTDLDLKPVPSNFSLFNSIQGSIGTYSSNKDTMNITYMYGAGSTVYVVKQKWTRQ